MRLCLNPETHRQTDRHINTMTRTGLSAGPSENSVYTSGVLLFLCLTSFYSDMFLCLQNPMIVRTGLTYHSSPTQGHQPLLLNTLSLAFKLPLGH